MNLRGMRTRPELVTLCLYLILYGFIVHDKRLNESTIIKAGNVTFGQLLVNQKNELLTLYSIGSHKTLRNDILDK